MVFRVQKRVQKEKGRQEKIGLTFSKGLSSGLAMALLLVILLLGGSGFWLAYQSGWDLEDLMTWAEGSSARGSVFAEGRGFTQAEARKVYLKARTALSKERYVDAVSGFKSLEKVYPGLLDVILLHEAEAYAKMPDEFRVQQGLSQLLKKRRKSVLRSKARYQRAQSHLRAKEYEAARKDFKAVIRLYPESDYALGSHYYMGVLLQRDDASAPLKSLSYWRHYIDEMPKGRFSADIASQMASLLPKTLATGAKISSDDHRRMGLGYAHGERSWDKAVTHLKQVPLAEAWLELGRGQLKLRQTQAGLNTLSQGIAMAKDKQRLKAGVDMLVRNSSKSKVIQRLQALSRKPLLLDGGDYVFWKLSQLNSSQARGYYQQILERYPEGDYAPESSWQRLWPLVRSGRYSAFLEQSTLHLKRYPYARSAAQTLFWRGKLLEKQGQINDATWAYESLLKKYPVSYYAFRASGRLADLKGDSGDPGWKIQKSRLYPPLEASEVSQGIQIMDELGFLKKDPMDTEERYFWKIVEELEAIGATDDVPLMLKAKWGSVPAIVESRQMHLKGDRPQGIRMIRDDLYRRAREGDLSGFNPSKNEMKLLYPLYFTGEIQKEAPANDLDPFIVQSLMREESYFNELAVSRSNALGLMQLLPSTAREVAGWVGIRPFQKLSLFQPSVNVKLGSRYLGHLHQLFNGDSMLSVGAYNGGPNAMKGWVRRSSVFAQDRDMFVEMIPYAQTRNYIKKVYGSFWNYSRLYSEAS